MVAKIDSSEVGQSRNQQPGDGEVGAIGRQTLAGGLTPADYAKAVGHQGRYNLEKL